MVEQGLVYTVDMNDTAEMRADVAIAGGGMAGLELAYWLGRYASDKLRVVVVEAGNAGSGVHARNGGLPLRRWRPWTSTSDCNYAADSGLARTLGGRSLHWHGVVLPIEAWALEKWPQSIVHELNVGWDGGAGLYSQVSTDLVAWVGNHSTLYPSAIELFGESWQPTPRARRWSGDPANGTWEAYTPLSRMRELSWECWPTVITHSIATEVLVRDGVTQGLVVRSERPNYEIKIYSPIVVLAASSIPNAKLAQSAFQSPVGVFSGLCDHMDIGFMALVPLAELSVVLADAARHGSSHYLSKRHTNIFLRLQIGQAGSSLATVELYATTEQRPDCDNRVVIDNTRQTPRVEAEFREVDWEHLNETGAILARMWNDIMPTCAQINQMPNWEECPGTSTQLRKMTVDDESGPLAWRSNLGSVDHESCCIPFGSSLDVDGSLRGLTGTYVLGAASFPRAGAANPSLTVLALARRMARTLASDNGAI